MTKNNEWMDVKKKKTVLILKKLMDILSSLYIFIYDRKGAKNLHQGE
jgi:hypothetical protein